MAAGFLDPILPDINSVAQKIDAVENARPGHLGTFAHLEIDSIQKYFHPALVLLSGRLFNYTGEKLIHLAYVVQLIYLASCVHFGIPDNPSKDKSHEDPRNGSQLPVLVGDYLYGKFFDGLCQGQILEFLNPLSAIIAEMNFGALQRRKNSGYLAADFELARQIVDKETAQLAQGACKMAGTLAGAQEEEIARLADFGYNVGMAYGLLERNLGHENAAPYFAKALQALGGLPDGPGRQGLEQITAKLRSGELAVPQKKIGRSGEFKHSRMGDLIIPEQFKNKEEYVHSIFSNIAKKYDFLNTILSFNRDKSWRRFTVEQTGLRTGGQALDVCCGTGMITLELAKKAGPSGKVTGLDFNAEMLAVAKANLHDSPFAKNVEYIQGNAMELPFPDNTFDCVTVGFGLRNVPDMKKSLGEMIRVSKPGGRVVCLEFSKPQVPIFKQIYHFYFDKWVPFLGKLGVGLDGPYRYLHNSWKVFPHQKELADDFARQGLEEVNFYELTGGVVSVHVGVKPQEGVLPSVAATTEDLPGGD